MIAVVFLKFAYNILWYREKMKGLLRKIVRIINAPAGGLVCLWLIGTAGVIFEV